MRKINRAVKIRIYPNAEQRVQIEKTIGCSRFIYNYMLADKMEHYKKEKKMLRNTPASYKKEYPWLKEVDSLALANVQMHLESAFHKFFREPSAGFPRFKSKKSSRKSYTTNNQNGTVAVIDSAIKLPKTGKVKAVIHRKPLKTWKIKSVTISQDAVGCFYASVLFEYDTSVTPMPICNTNKIVGLDYKSDGLYVDSNGTNCDMDKYYKKSHSKLAKEQKKLAKKLGFRKNEHKSHNYIKYQHKLAKLHKHIKNQRYDFLHKKSAEIANHVDVVCVENLNMKALANKNFGNGKATLDNGYGMFLSMLEYKLADRGKHFVKVSKWYPSSQICSCCGKQQKLALSERVYKCNCGLVIDRDYNAAINIKNEGLRILCENIA